MQQVFVMQAVDEGTFLVQNRYKRVAFRRQEGDAVAIMLEPMPRAEVAQKKLVERAAPRPAHPGVVHSGAGR